MSKQITVLDFGSNKIAAATASIDRLGEISLSAFENLYSRGISEDGITDINKAVEDISAIMNKLERHGRKKIKHVFVTARGSDIEMRLSRGTIPLSKTPREITKRDIARCLELAAMIKLPMNRGVLQKIVKGFHIDGRPSTVGNPIGLYGIKLDVESFIATASLSKIHNITKCIDHAGFLLEGIYLSSMASASATLDAEEKEKGVLLLDIGETLKEALVFKNGLLQNYSATKRGARLNSISNKKNDFSSIVVTGEGALHDGLIEETEKAFKIPARIGIVKNAKGSYSNSQDAIIHTSTAGLINDIANEYRITHAGRKNPISQAFRKLFDIYESYF